MRPWLVVLGTLGGLFGALGVGLAAAGAHLSGEPGVTTSANFLLFHAGAVLALCALARDPYDRGIMAATSLIALGVILFSGDLALRGLAHTTLVRMAAPTGGVIMILGWLVATGTVAARLSRSRDS